MADNERNDGDVLVASNEVANVPSSMAPSTPLLRSAFTLLRAYWPVLMAGLIAGAALGGLYFVFAAKQYTATGSLFYEEDRQDGTSLASLSAPTGGFLQNPLRLSTQVQVLESDSLATDVINQLHLGKDPFFSGKLPFEDHPSSAQLNQALSIFHHAVSVSIVPKTEVIEIKVRTRSADTSAKIVNALMNAYIERSFRVRYEASEKMTQWLSLQLEAVRQRTEAADRKLAEYQRDHGLQVAEDQGSTALTRLDILTKAATNAQSERILREARYRAALSGNALVLSGQEGSATLTALRVREADLKNQYANLTTEFGRNYPKVREIESQIQQVEAAIRSEIASITQRLRKEYDVATVSENALNAQADLAKKQAYALNEGAIQLQILRRDAKTNRDLYEDLLTKLQEAGVMAGLRSSNVNVVDYARPMNNPSDPKLVRSLGGGMLAGLFLGIVCAFTYYSLRDAIRSIEEAEQALGRPVLGVVPFAKDVFSKKPSQGESVLSTLGLFSSSSAISSSIRSIRTAILLSRPTQPPQVLLVTSSQPGEGKSTLSLCLAVVFAQKGNRVLLIDADFHRGRIYRQLGLSNSAGLSTALTSLTDPMAVIQPVRDVETLFFLAGGPAPPQPADLIDSVRMDEIVKQYRQQFDFIVIDAPPLLATPEPVILSRQTDSTIMVVRHEETRRGALVRSLQSLQNAHVNILGAVYNAVPDRADYGNYYYYGYYGSEVTEKES